MTPGKRASFAIGGPVATITVPDDASLRGLHALMESHWATCNAPSAPFDCLACATTVWLRFVLPPQPKFKEGST